MYAQIGEVSGSLSKYTHFSAIMTKLIGENMFCLKAHQLSIVLLSKSRLVQLRIYTSYTKTCFFLGVTCYFSRITYFWSIVLFWCNDFIRSLYYFWAILKHRHLFRSKTYMPPPLPYFKVNLCPLPLPHFASIFFAYLWSLRWPNYIVTLPR